MYNYHRYRLELPSMEPNFYFRKSRAGSVFTPGSADGKRVTDGSIYCKLTLGETNYPPFSTGIKGLNADWLGRVSLRPSASALALADQLRRFQETMEFAYAKLQDAELMLTLDLLLEEMRYIRACEQLGSKYVAKDKRDVAELGGQLVTLTVVYEQFMAAKGRVVESNHRKRSDGQISDATYSSYPKRWALILGYLGSCKKSKLEVSKVNYALCTNLREWMQCQTTPTGTFYKIATINKVIGFLKTLISYAMSKGYVNSNPITDFPCRGSSTFNPKPLTSEQMITLEHFPLPPTLRHICDSWIVAAELCLHYSDFMQLRGMEILVTGGTDGKAIRRFIRHDRQKQSGSELWQTVNITPRAERIFAKWGISGLAYKSSQYYSRMLKKIAVLVDLRDKAGELVPLQFGQGRDTGLTARAVAGAGIMTLANMGGWRKAAHAASYIDGAMEMVDNFARRDEVLAASQ